MKMDDLKILLEAEVERHNTHMFIEKDPILIPHEFSLKQDIEISAFWTAILAWGQRVTIINKAKELFALMDNAPYDFIINHTEKQRKRFDAFKHRTFNYTDTLYFLDFLQRHYKENESLESAFLNRAAVCMNVEDSLIRFRDQFFKVEYAPQRTFKHIASPAINSSCKRLNMFLRWMVRSDDNGVDFGLWKNISSSQLMIPLDVHVAKSSRQLGLLKRKQNDWKAVKELTEVLRGFDSQDPVKYDFALFGMGLVKR